ncbi:hypothetical protein [Streptomyces sp. CB01881]|uniref:hypothetical protein n=1 Tax=Streptomyces sp. CB01881 TaxID=2078691 RepID=UPI0011DF7391|nr:hypothetical protein [Streptomyces sp. CB01881]TYC69400.1 hypothetical protein EH183_35000 [Streptomyces sp. CB01881]
MARSRTKKQKRPLAEGVVRPPRPAGRKGAGRRRAGNDRQPSPRTVRRTALLTGIFAPVLMVGLLAIATNPDYNAVGMILAVLVLIGALGGLVVVRASGWVLWPGVLLGILLIVTPVNSLRAELIDHRGTAADVVITSAHRQKDRSGRVSWTCGIRRADGLPLPHGSYDGSGCSSAASVGTTITVLVDPEGWAPPAATNAEVPFVGGVYVVGGVAALWALLVLGAARRTLREHGRT